MSIWKNAKKLYPGHYILVENGKVKIEKYWHLEPQFILNENKEKMNRVIDNLGPERYLLLHMKRTPCPTFYENEKAMFDYIMMNTNIMEEVKKNIYTNGTVLEDMETVLSEQNRGIWNQNLANEENHV